MGKVKQALEQDMMHNPENYNNPDPLKEDMVSEMDDFLDKHIIIGRIPDDSSSQQSNWEKGFNILMEYWDCIPDDEKPKIHKQLEELNL